jgi:hypothetical protein
MTVNIFLPQVTRIPITGPAPYNTLVCVSTESYLGPQELRDGVMSRFPIHIVTPFHLAGFDQRVPPVFDHSTTAWINSIGPIKDGNWVYAVDSVTGAGFTPTDGIYYIDLMAASSPDGTAPGTCMAFGEGASICFYFIKIQVTSWVLCYEPPVVQPPAGHVHRFSDRVQEVISLPSLAHTPPASPVRTAAAEHTQKILQQFGVPVTVSVSSITDASPANGSTSERRGCPKCGSNRPEGSC